MTHAIGNSFPSPSNTLSWHSPIKTLSIADTLPDSPQSPSSSTSASLHGRLSAPPCLPETKENFQKNLQAIRHCFPACQENTINQLLNRILSEQVKLHPAQSVELTIPGFPHPIHIRKQSFQVLEKQVGKGTESNVFSGPLFAQTPHSFGSENLSPSKPSSSFALKTSRQPNARPRALKTQLETVFSPEKRGNVDMPLDLTHTPKGRAASLHKLCSSDFTQVNYLEYDYPVSHLIQMFLAILPPLQYLHDKGMVHRDIKGGNLLTCSDPKLSLLSDQSFMTSAFYTPERTIGTPRYLNPNSFNFGDGYLVNEYRRIGLQRPCDDMYALGITAFECISKLVSQFASKKITFSKSVCQFIPHDKRLNFTKDELIGIQNAYPLQGEFYHADKDKKKPAFVHICQKIDERCAALFSEIEGCEKFNLDKKEVLKKFAEICFSVLAADDEKRLKAGEMKEQLQPLLKESFPQKRLNFNVAEEEPGRGKRPKLLE